MSDFHKPSYIITLLRCSRKFQSKRKNATLGLPESDEDESLCGKSCLIYNPNIVPNIITLHSVLLVVNSYAFQCIEHPHQVMGKHPPDSARGHNLHPRSAATRARSQEEGVGCRRWEREVAQAH